MCLHSLIRKHQVVLGYISVHSEYVGTDTHRNTYKYICAYAHKYTSTEMHTRKCMKYINTKCINTYEYIMHINAYKYIQTKMHISV
jgi:hypothetical protein